MKITLCSRSAALIAGHRLVVRGRPAQSYAVNAGADVGAQLHHIEGFGQRLHSVSMECHVNGLAGRDPKLRPG